MLDSVHLPHAAALLIINVTIVINPQIEIGIIIFMINNLVLIKALIVLVVIININCAIEGL